MRRALLALALLAATAAAQAPDASFGPFLAEFRAALARNDAAAVADRTRLPLLFEGREHDRGALVAAYPRLFDPATRRCLARAKPVPDADGVTLFCGRNLYRFERTAAGWRFTDLGVDD